MDKIKNPDIVAMLTTGSALLSDVVARVIVDESLLAQLPPWAVLLGLFLAALARFRFGHRPAPEAIDPAPVTDDAAITADDAGDGEAN